MICLRLPHRNKVFVSGGVCLVLLVAVKIASMSARNEVGLAAGRGGETRNHTEKEESSRRFAESGRESINVGEHSGFNATTGEGPDLLLAAGETATNCSRIASYKSAIGNRSCFKNYELLQACPPSGRYGRQPLGNFYLTFENDSANFEEFAKEYRAANVAYVHLPKSGGTSVEKVLFREPGLKFKDQKSGNQLSHCRDFYRAVRGHSRRSEKSLYYSKRSYGIHKYVYPDRPFLYVTWFRHPVERIVSTYYYLKKHKCFGFHKICKDTLLKSASLRDYLRRTAGQRQSLQDIDNFTVRLLLFDEFPEVASTFEDCCASADHAADIPVIGERHYLKAKENLEQRMAFVGILEDWKTSQDMLTRMLRIRNIKDEVHVNANSHRGKLSDYELKEIERRNHWDLKLYQDALRIYEKQKAVFSNLVKQ